MIEGICIYIGKIIGIGATPRDLNGSYLYFIRTPYHGMKYLKTDKSLQKGEFVFYIEVDNSNYKTNEVFYYRRFDDVKIIEVNNYYLNWSKADIPKGVDFCIVKPFCADKYDLCYYFEKEFFTINNKKYRNRTGLNERDEELIRYIIERKKLKSCHTIIDAFYNPINYEEFKTKEKDIIDKVESINVSDIIDRINSYTITHEHLHITRVGRDDIYRECFNSEYDRYNKGVSISDSYIAQFSPKPYYDRYWDDSIPAPLELTSMHRKRAKTFEEEVKKNAINAIKKYNKNDHLKTLLNEFINEMALKATNPQGIINFVWRESRIYEQRGFVKGMICCNDKYRDFPILYQSYNEEQANEYCNNCNNKRS